MELCDGYLRQRKYSSMCPLSDFCHGCSTGYAKFSWLFPKFYFTKENWKKVLDSFLHGHTKNLCWDKQEIVKNTNAYKNHNIDPNELKLGL